MNLAEKIVSLRKVKGLTQELLAEYSNISLRTIQRIECNKSQPRVNTLKRIAKILEVDVNELNLSKSDNLDSEFESQVLSKIQLINSSSLIGTLIPFLNIIVPLLIWKTGKVSKLCNEKAKKIISFQVLWTLISIFILSLSQIIHYKIMGQFYVGRVPLIFFIYLFMVLINIYFIYKAAKQLRDNNSEIYTFMPSFF